MKPALTKEEWVQAHGEGVPERSTKMILDDTFAVTIEWQNAEDETTGISYIGKERHALAALCLYGQPFGFTRGDVKALEYRGIGYDEGHNQDALDSLARRIEALLPPETP